MVEKEKVIEETIKYDAEESGIASVLPPGTCISIFHPSCMKVLPIPLGTSKIIGRDASAEVAIPDPKLSRKHVQFTKTGEDLLVNDLGSTNGTFINGLRIYSPTRVFHGDEIRAGSCIINVIEVLPVSEETKKEGKKTQIPDDLQEEVIIKDPCMVKIFESASLIASSYSSVIIMGETGVGKEVIAKHIHKSSPYRAGPFVPINCSAIPENIAESEFFGHEKGAFTGASERRIGLLESAEGGTVFLDEFTDMPLSIQAKLLRFLDDHKIRRMGGSKEINLNVRIICATNKNIENEVQKGNFRKDLYFRLSQFTIYIPPLRVRPLETVALSEYFIRRMAIRSRKNTPRLSEDAVNFLTSYSWPGNIRQLRNVVERAVVFCDEDKITEVLLMSILNEEYPDRSSIAEPAGINEKVQDFEMKTIIEALKECGGNQSKAARKLGITRRTLIYRMKKYGIR